MTSISQRLIQTAAGARRFLDRTSRNEIARFILNQQNPDGGFRGRAGKSDLYYTVFAAGSLKALGRWMPLLRLWNYVRSFGAGGELDLVHLVCLIRLRTAFPMSGKTREQLFQSLEKLRSESAYDLFLKMLAEDYLCEARYPEEQLIVSPNDPTTNLAAGIIVNRLSDAASEQALLSRACPGGGFAPAAKIPVPDLLSTATALFALTSLGCNLDSIRKPCLEYVESLWRDSGGFSGHVDDQHEDVEYTFYALLSIGCLMED